ncbi:MAG: hypothetical protein KAI70_03470 [Candidatus Omnitrophica bacterium]|nr:hypothetical protein [Candidatus Omnitrophota bacterium]
MTNETWNIKELRELLGDKLAGECGKRFEAYVDSYIYKQRRTVCHKKTFNKITGELFSKSKIDFDNQEVQFALDSAMAEVEAIAQLLNSLGDILVQIVNLIILGDKGYPEDRVYIKTVIDKLEQTNKAPKVLEKLENLFDGDAYKYVRAFCNVTKHTRIIDWEYYWSFKPGKSEHGVRFRDFHYKENDYLKISSDTIMEEYSNKIYDDVVSVGKAINEAF